VWIADLNGRVVGHVALSRPNGEDAVSLWLDQGDATEGEVAVLACLFVTPEARRTALGRRLTEAPIEYGDDHGLRLALDVTARPVADAALPTTTWDTQGPCGAV
jgi:GNAT superfamily N-acetyltransferase